MKKLIATFGVMLMCSFGIFASIKQPKPLFAEPETSEVADTSEEVLETSEEPKEEEPEEPVTEEEVEEKVIEKIKEFKDTYLVPLLGSVSLTSILSAVFTIFVAFKNRKTNKLISNTNSNTQQQSLELINKVESVLKLVDELVETIEKSEAINEETRELIKKEKNEINQSIANLTDETTKILEMKKCMVMLIQVATELVKINPQAVSGGVAKKVEALSEQAKKML